MTIPQAFQLAFQHHQAGRLPDAEALYRQILAVQPKHSDALLALDPFPYNGMTATCDAWWMGVPMLTLPGELPASRSGLSLLSTLGLRQLVASSEEDCVRIAVELAGNLPRLAELRATLRPRMQASPLMDGPRFARNVETAYRSMWERWRPMAVAHPQSAAGSPRIVN
jgi:predicted O-linked N-acetylglucosamine transferase (SPINDLY family)